MASIVPRKEMARTPLLEACAPLGLCQSAGGYRAAGRTHTHTQMRARVRASGLQLRPPPPWPPRFCHLPLLVAPCFSSQAAPPPNHTSTGTLPPGASGLGPGGEGSTAGNVRVALLEASLRHVPRHGWTWEALSAGAADLGCVALPPPPHSPAPPPSPRLPPFPLPAATPRWLLACSPAAPWSWCGTSCAARSCA